MTRLGVISDVHANHVALDAVLADLPPVDRIVCAGDIVGYYPWPRECVDQLRETDVPTIQGNHDRAVVTGETARLNPMATAGIEYARGELTDDHVAWLRELPVSREVADGRVTIVHGHPDDPDHYTSPSEVDIGLLGDADALVLGHTHVQFTEYVDEGVVLNPGSVGQPRDGDPRAAYSVLDLDTLTVEEHRVEYDIERVQAAVAAAGLPERVGERLAVGR